MRELRRIALWGIAAAAALAVAVYSSTTRFGHERVAQAATHLRALIQPASAKIDPAKAREEQLAATLRLLTTEHARLLTRVDGIERSIGDINVSMAHVQKAVQEIRQVPKPEPPAVKVEATPPAPAAEDITASINVPDGVPMPRPAPALSEAKAAPPPESARRPEFGVDLGGANSIAGLRSLWAASRHRHAGLLEGLHAIVQLRERPRAFPELRLVAGPFADATAAARFCATIATAGSLCRPAPFDGQRLETR